MFISGFMGSPRKDGNTSSLLKSFMAEAEKYGAETAIVNVSEKNITPCTGCSVCEKKGACHFDDDMENEILPLLRKSDIVIIATPIYFCTAPSKLKALIDRTQTLWARKYKLGLTDPGEKFRRGFMLAVGSSKDKDLFKGMRLTLKYFFRGIAAEFAGELTYNSMKDTGDIKNRDTTLHDIENAVTKLASPLKERKTILFTCSQNTGRSQMAGAFAQHLAGDRFNVLSAGSMPAKELPQVIVDVMAEKGFDLAFRQTRSIDSVVAKELPDYVVTMGGGDETCIHIAGPKTAIWQVDEQGIPNPEQARQLRDDIENRVIKFIGDIDSD